MLIERVSSPRALAEFLELVDRPAEALEARLDDRREPFWWSARRELFLLRDGRRVIGRIGAVHNLAHDRTHGPGTGFFAWLHAPDSPLAVKLLWDAAATWLRREGCHTVRGPLHLGLGEDLGLRVAGFDDAPGSLSPWNPAYIADHLRVLGLNAVAERHGYRWRRGDVPAPVSLRHVGKRPRRQSGSASYRPLDPLRLGEEIQRFVATYNAGMSNRLGFVPLSEAEARARLQSIQATASLGLVWLAEVNGVPAGITVAVPVLEKGGAGGLLGALRSARAAMRQRRVRRVHLMVVAVDPQFRSLHVGAQLLLRVWRAALDLGIEEAELSGVDAEDQDLQQLLWRLGCERVRRYEILEASISPLR